MSDNEVRSDDEAWNADLARNTACDGYEDAVSLGDPDDDMEDSSQPVVGASQSTQPGSDLFESTQTVEEAGEADASLVSADAPQVVRPMPEYPIPPMPRASHLRQMQGQMPQAFENAFNEDGGQRSGKGVSQGSKNAKKRVTRSVAKGKEKAANKPVLSGGSAITGGRALESAAASRQKPGRVSTLEMRIDKDVGELRENQGFLERQQEKLDDSITNVGYACMDNDGIAEIARQLAELNSASQRNFDAMAKTVAAGRQDDRAVLKEILAGIASLVAATSDSRKRSRDREDGPADVAAKRGRLEGNFAPRGGGVRGRGTPFGGRPPLAARITSSTATMSSRTPSSAPAASIVNSGDSIASSSRSAPPAIPVAPIASQVWVCFGPLVWSPRQDELMGQFIQFMNMLRNAQIHNLMVPNKVFRANGNQSYLRACYPSRFHAMQFVNGWNNNTPSDYDGVYAELDSE